VFSSYVRNARGKTFHLVFYAKFQFLESYFFEEVFGVVIRGERKFLEGGIVLLVLLYQTLILGVCFKYYVPRVPLSSCHAFLLLTDCDCNVKTA
jgi:hypothetical protein